LEVIVAAKAAELAGVTSTVVEAGGPIFPAMPSPEQVAAARAERKAASEASILPQGTVQGLPEGWRAAKLDPSLDAGRKAVLRAKWKGKGWIPLEGLHQVVGYPLGAEVWVKSEADWQADRRERDELLKKMAANGTVMLGMA